MKEEADMLKNPAKAAAFILIHVSALSTFILLGKKLAGRWRGH